jgi:hypothetical protein
VGRGGDAEAAGVARRTATTSPRAKNVRFFIATLSLLFPGSLISHVDQARLRCQSGGQGLSPKNPPCSYG